jgi:hypothetical protein
VIPLESYRLRVKYSDGVEGVVDLSSFAGHGVFALWNDYQEFEKVHIGRGGEIAWSDQIDMCPDAIYLQITGQKPEDVFPKLRELTRYV